MVLAEVMLLLPTKQLVLLTFTFAFLILVGQELEFQFSRSISIIFHPERPKFSNSRLQLSFSHLTAYLVVLAPAYRITRYEISCASKVFVPAQRS